MKRFITIGLVCACAVFLVAACGGGGSSVPLAKDASVVSLADSDGNAFIGGALIPTKSIVATFDVAVSSVDVAIACDGIPVDLAVTALSAAQYRIAAADGRFPQMTSCTIDLSTTAAASLNAGKALFEYAFDVGCDVQDLFDNPKTWACWASWGSAEAEIIPGGLLEVSNLGGVPAENRAVMIYKRVRGDLEVLMDVESIEYEFTIPDVIPQALEYNILLIEDATIFNPDGSLFAPFAGVGYKVGVPKNSSDVEFRVVARSFDGALAETAAADVDSKPAQVGLIREGAIFTPFYVLQDGVRRFFDLGGGITSFDMSSAFDAAADLDMAMVIFGDHIILGTVLVDDVLVEGDAVVVE